MDQQYDIGWLKSQFKSGKKMDFLFFWGSTNKYKQDVGDFCFSQWHIAPFIVDNITYKTAEHWMMAQKALLFRDVSSFHKIVFCESPGEAKKLGRQVLNFNEITWDKNRFAVVKAGNFHKFSQNLKLGKYLLNTDSKVLVEASPVDSIWGIGMAKESSGIYDPQNWRGLNLLGFALMEVREIIKANFI